MDFIIEQLITWWQFTVVGVLIIVGWIINLMGVDQDEPIVNLKYDEMPSMIPIKIPTAGKGFWSAIWMWLMTVRTWTIGNDWHFSVNGEDYVIPKGFVFDGASVPKFLASWLSPVGVLLIGGLVHDYIYKYKVLIKKDKKSATDEMNQKQADQLFRDINIEQNGFHFLNNLAYWALRIGGFVAWNGHRKRNCDWKESVK
jgi:hypothetical protein